MSHNSSQLKPNGAGSGPRLKIRCCIDMSRVVVLVQRGSEWRTTVASSTGTVSLLSVTGTNSGATHQVGRLIRVVTAALLGADPPNHDPKDTNDEGTTNTHYDTDDDLLVLRRQTGVTAVLAGRAKRRRTGRPCIISSARHGCRKRSPADGVDRSDSTGSSSGMVRSGLTSAR